MKNTKIRVLALSWRDIQSPSAGGAEINTHEIFKRLNSGEFEIVHISPRYDGLQEHETIDGITYLRYGNIASVIFYAIRYYHKHKNEIDFVIDQCNTHRFFTPLWVHKAKRVLLIYQLTREIWDINLNFPFNKIGKLLENSLLRLNKNDLTITESESTKQDLIDVGFDTQKIFVIPIIMKIQPWSSNQFLPKNLTPQFVYVGRYAKYKGIDAAVEAIGLLKQSGIHTQLIVLGKKNDAYINQVLFPICLKYSLKLYAPDCYDVNQDSKEYYDTDIILAGFVSEEDKLKILSSARALVFPSNREGWGIPVSEAAYVGTPSIVYNSPGLRDAVDYGRAGYLCKESSAQGICEQMLHCIDNLDGYERITRAAYNFSVSYLNGDVNKLLQNILDRGNET